MLAPTGKLQPNGGAHDSGRWVGALGHVVANTVRSFFSGQVLAPFLSMNNPEDLVVLREMAEAGKISPVIDRTFPLSESASALAYVGDGHASGTVVITMG